MGTITMSGQANDRGLTLVELVVVLAVFGLMATLGLQALSGTLRTRDRLVKLDQDVAGITLALSLLRSDLQNAVPLQFHAPDGSDQSAFDVFTAGQGFAVSVSGWRDLPGQNSAGLGRVIWQYEAGQGELTRAGWPVLIPANQEARSIDVVVATGITGLEIRTMTPEMVWTRGNNQAIRGTSGSLPRAVEITLHSAVFGRISTLVSYP